MRAPGYLESQVRRSAGNSSRLASRNRRRVTNSVRLARQDFRVAAMSVVRFHSYQHHQRPHFALPSTLFSGLFNPFLHSRRAFSAALSWRELHQSLRRFRPAAGPGSTFGTMTAINFGSLPKIPAACRKLRQHAGRTCPQKARVVAAGCRDSRQAAELSGRLPGFPASLPATNCSRAL